MQKCQQIIRLVLLSAVMLFMSGCAWKIHTQGVGDICSQFVEVHIVGINHYEKDTWMGISMQDYWRDTTGLRSASIQRGDTYEAKFSPSLPCEITLSEKDKIWKKWQEKDATHFLVLTDSSKDENAWRVCLPMPNRKKHFGVPTGWGCWEGRAKKKTIEIRIEPSAVVPLTTPKPNCDNGG